MQAPRYALYVVLRGFANAEIISNSNTSTASDEDRTTRSLSLLAKTTSAESRRFLSSSEAVILDTLVTIHSQTQGRTHKPLLFQLEACQSMA
jgi:hypothetical protein